MSGKKGVIPISDISKTSATCQNCKYMVKEEVKSQRIKMWLCYRYPPNVISDGEGGTWVVRAEVDPDEKACGEFVAVN